jgi:hypothetical protein
MSNPAQVGLKLVPPATLGDVLFVEWDRPKVEHGTPCDQ